MSQRDDAGLINAIDSLAQSVDSVVRVLHVHGVMLTDLLAAAEKSSDERRMHELLEGLIGRLDRQQVTLERIEKGIGTFNAKLAEASGP